MIENLPFIKFSPAVSPEIETTNTWLLMAKFCAIPEEYEKFLSDAHEILIKYGAKEEKISKLKELSSKVMATFMTMNKPDKEIAKLMMEGNQKGVLEITAELNNYDGNDEEILSLARRLLATEEHNREEFKTYL